MSSSKASAHPLILRPQEIARSHRLQAREDKRGLRATPKEHPAIRAFYTDSASRSIHAAVLIEDAIRQFPLAATDCAGAVRSPSHPSKKGARS